MLRTRFTQLIKHLLRRSAHSHFFLPMVSVLTFAAAISMSVPATAALIPAVLLRPKQWPVVCLAGVLGTACGATLIAYGFHSDGWQALQARFPELSNSGTWLYMLTLVRQYGIAALAVICALPLPQTPALIMCAISDVPLTMIFLAVALGKLAKYGLFSWMAATFPHRFVTYLHKQQ